MMEVARAAVASGGHRLPLASVTPEAPIPRPGKIPRSGINHQGHAEGKPNARMPKEPFFLAKLSTAVIGHEGPIPHPTRTRQLDGEVELAEGVGVPHNPVVAG